MNRNEQEILEKIRKKTAEIQPPDSLGSETVRERLAGVRKKRPVWKYLAVPAAACLVIVAGISIYSGLGGTGGGTSAVPAETVVEEISGSGSIASADSYEEIYDQIQEGFKEQRSRSWVVNESADMIAATESQSSASDGAAKTAETGADYSETNLRQQGVDEGDLVKTDGNYLYVVETNQTEVGIVKTGNALEETGEIRIKEGWGIEEIYVVPEEKQVILVCSKNLGDVEFYPEEEQAESMILTYDVSEPEEPELEGEVTQSGWYHSSRLAEGVLYLFTQYDVGTDIQEARPETYIPQVQGKLLEESEIFLPPYGQGTLYEIVTAVDLEKPQETRESRAIFSKGGDLYVSGENIYYYETVWTEKGQREMTTIRKISYRDGELEPEAQGAVDGYINDSFSIDEYEGRLRIVTTVGDTNSVTVLDEELQTTGEITGLAKDERIYSARFLGEVGYFVTFRETDPLFSVDFSDPDKPRIIGKLKIPGFSDYLHSYREGQLLGIGMDVDEKTQITGGVKLTMFDVTDPADVKEADTYVLENVYNTDVSYDYKAALVDGEKDLIGFPADSEGGRIYYLFSYDTETGFQRLMEEEVNGGGWATRGIYIGDRLYVVDGNVIEAYSLEDYEKLDGLIL